MQHISIKQGDNVIIGPENADDASAVKIGNEIILQTVDIITPVVSEPFLFGQIAAVNSLSDIYAMGGIPVSVLNIACFPTDCLELSILEEILQGGLSKIYESGASLVGGHTITDKEIKYGLSVVGIAHNNLYHNALCKEQLDIILTKPLGGGILSTALKAEMADEAHKKEMIKWMTRLNKYASEIAQKVGIVTMTDITGFGLLGHLLEVLKASKVSAIIYKNNINFMDGFEKYISFGLIPAGAYRNKEFVANHTRGDNELILKLSVPETSGGLMIFCEKSKTKELLEKIIEGGDTKASVIGETIKDERSFIYIT